jgi:hypothetical protein
VISHLAESRREEDDRREEGARQEGLEDAAAQALRLELAWELLETGWRRGDVVVGGNGPLSIAKRALGHPTGTDLTPP